MTQNQKVTWKVALEKYWPSVEDQFRIQLMDQGDGADTLTITFGGRNFSKVLRREEKRQEVIKLLGEMEKVCRDAKEYVEKMPVIVDGGKE